MPGYTCASGCILQQVEERVQISVLHVNMLFSEWPQNESGSRLNVIYVCLTLLCPVGIYSVYFQSDTQCTIRTRSLRFAVNNITVKSCHLWISFANLFLLKRPVGGFGPFANERRFVTSAGSVISSVFERNPISLAFLHVSCFVQRTGEKRYTADVQPSKNIMERRISTTGATRFSPTPLEEAQAGPSPWPWPAPADLPPVQMLRFYQITFISKHSSRVLLGDRPEVYD